MRHHGIPSTPGQRAPVRRLGARPGRQSPVGVCGRPPTVSDQWSDPSPLPPRPQGAAARGKTRPAPNTGFAGIGSRGEPDPDHFALPQSESSLSQDPNSGDFQARRIEPSRKGTTA